MKRSQQVVVFLIFLISIGFVTPAFAAYHVSFVSDVARITAPTGNGLSCQGYVNIEGTSKLEQIWLCVRGPADEVTTYPVNVIENAFQYELSLRFGAGTYTIWVGDSSEHFDGNIRFEVTNTLNADLRYAAPSAYVDSKNEIVTQLSSSLVKPEMTDNEKLAAIYQWVTQNIAYDYNAYKEQANILKPASVIIQEKKGMCRDYSFTVAALARASGLEAKIVYGQARNGENGRTEYHAWNEVKLNGNWIFLDSTWDAGYVKSGQFFRSPQLKFFNMESKGTSQTHQVEKITLH